MRALVSVLLLAALSTACVRTTEVGGRRPVETALLDTARLRASFDFPSCAGGEINFTANPAQDTVDVQACGKHARYRCPERMQLPRSRGQSSYDAVYYRVCELDTRPGEAPCAQPVARAAGL